MHRSSVSRPHRSSHHFLMEGLTAPVAASAVTTVQKSALLAGSYRTCAIVIIE